MIVDQPVGVLVITPSPPLLERLASLIAEHGGIGLIGKAASAAEARQRLRATGFDVVLVDVCGGAAGLLLLREIRSAAPMTLIAALTLDSSPELQERCEQLGADVSQLMTGNLGAMIDSLVDRLISVRGYGHARC